VSFCDATATYCTDIHLLATAQLTSSGTASYKFRPGIGSHSYKAVFVGTNSYARSISSASALTVTGTIPTLATAATINQTGSCFAPGSGGTTSLTVTPGTTTGNTGTISVVGTNGFSGIVNLTCGVTTRLTGVSDMPTCSLNPTSVTISGAAAQTSTLTVKTTAASSAENQNRSLFWPSASGATFAFVLLFVKPRKRKGRVALVRLLLLFLSTGLVACGGGNSGSGGGGGGANTGATPGAYTITVTGTSGSASAMVGVIALTVQ